MHNRIKTIEKIEKEVRMGYPNGSIDAWKYIPELLARIKELENTLAPFARVGMIEERHTQPDKLVHVYLKDCLSAKDQLDSNKSIQLPVEDFGVPAE